MTGLPETYYVSLVLFAVLLGYGMLQLHRDWAFAYNAVLCTVAAWYFVEPIYLPEEFEYFADRYVQTAYDVVLIFFLVFAIATPVLVQLLRPRATGTARLTNASLPPERLLEIIAGVWFVLLVYGISRFNWDVVGALFPLGNRWSNMWARAAAGDAGFEGFIVSTASYIYTLCLACFGVLLMFMRRRSYIQLTLLLIAISWPYAFLQGSRNITLAVVLPGIIAYLLLSRHSLVTKAFSLLGTGLILEFALRLMIHYRNEGFGSAELSDVKGTVHLGLNMASELVHSIEFLDRQILTPGYGLGYILELTNVIPRAIWPGKPLLGIDYAIARGYAGGGSDLGVFATISPGLLGQGAQEFGPNLGAIAAATLMALWVAILTRFRSQRTPLRISLFLIGLGLTFNLGRGITLLVLWPMIFGYVGVRIIEARSKHLQQRSQPPGEQRPIRLRAE